jgi:hypothetical protein
MRSAAELFEGLLRAHAEAVDAEGENVVFMQLAIGFSETTIGISANAVGLGLLSEAIKAGGIPVGYISAIRQSGTLIFKWAPLLEFGEDEDALETANCFLSAIAEATAWELKRARA